MILKVMILEKLVKNLFEVSIVSKLNKLRFISSLEYTFFNIGINKE